MPTTAGGTADILARLIGPKLTALWGQPVVVENRSGAGTLIDTEFAARAQPDGYTLMITYSELATLPALNKNARIDVVKDLTRVGKIGSLPVLKPRRRGGPAGAAGQWQRHRLRVKIQ
ncbi:putattive exported protein [Bordetella pertussis]|nr:putattive exported protein [Bordetella pertussis]